MRWNGGIDFARPGVDSAIQIGNLFETGESGKQSHPQAANPVVANHEGLPLRIEPAPVAARQSEFESLAGLGVA